MPPTSPGINAGHYYSNVVSPLSINLAFTVNAADTGGLGVTAVKSNGFVRNVFMHTSSTPGVNNGVTNPNPLAGYLMVQFNRNFNVYLAELMAVIGGSTGSIKIDNSALTAGQVYIITTLGNATLAKWQAIGVPAGVVPAVGVSFIALTNGGTGNTLTSRVSTPVPSGVSAMELVGTPSTMIANSSQGVNGGAYVFGQFLGVSFTGSALATHTHDFTVIGGQAASTTNDIADYAGPIIGKQSASNVTYIGANSATNGGVVAVSAGTPAGTATTALVTPPDGTIVSLKFWFDSSSVSVDGL